MRLSDKKNEIEIIVLNKLINKAGDEAQIVSLINEVCKLYR